MTMLMQNLLAASHQGFFYPVQASTIARDVDPLAWFIHIITIVFSVGIIGVTAWYAFRYRASVNPVPAPPGHNNVLEVTWTAIPAVIVFICFFWGFRVYMKMTVYQPAAYQIEAVGLQWSWQFKYPNPTTGAPVVSNVLYLPKDVPVEITLVSNDVLHALFLPAMRMKKDVVPGRFNTMLVEPTLEGEFDVYCAEYCGDSHSTMLAKAVVLSRDAYHQKIVDLSDPTKDPVTRTPLPPAQIGKNLATVNGCFSCHSSSGQAGTGPTWLDLYGNPSRPLAGGQSVAVDDNYILESIRNPNAKVAQGFGPPSSMNPYGPGQISNEYVGYIIAYMKTISKHSGSGPVEAVQPTPNPAAGPPKVAPPAAANATTQQSN